MPSIVPSQVVEAIDTMVGNSKWDDGRTSFGLDHSAILAGIADLVDAVPKNIMGACPLQYLPGLIQSMSSIRSMQPVWAAGHHRDAPVIAGKDVLKHIRRAMAALPDDYPPPQETGLEFITDAELRDSIRRDVGAARRALSNSEWKPATVMAGAAAEALLHWRLSQAATLPQAEAVKDVRVQGGIDNWGLGAMIDIAEKLKLLNATTAKAARLTQDYRNLIHPGNAIRKGLTCTSSTAHSAIGGMDGIIEALR